MTEHKTFDHVSVEGIFPPGHAEYPCVYKPEYKKFLFEKEFSCPSCKHTFTDYKIFNSKLVYEQPVRYDMREFYVDFSMEWYDVITCPACYFSMLRSQFTEMRNFSKLLARDSLGTAKDTVSMDFDSERSLSYVFTSHYLALLCAFAYSNHQNIIAKLWSNLSWLYEDAHHKELEVYAAAQAAKAFSDLYMQSRLTALQEQVVCLSAAGMLYRAGDYTDIKKWLFKAKTNRLGKKSYSNMADDLLQDLREKESVTV